MKRLENISAGRGGSHPNKGLLCTQRQMPPEPPNRPYKVRVHSWLTVEVKRTESVSGWPSLLAGHGLLTIPVHPNLLLADPVRNFWVLN